MKKYFSMILVFSVLCNIFPCAFADSSEYHLQRSKGNVSDDQAFMKHLKQMQRQRKGNKERPNIRFAIGEYYFKIHALGEAKKTFSEYLDKNPIGISTFLANVYLYKIALALNKHPDAEKIKKEIFNQQFVLLFDQYKTLPLYKSLNKNQYEVRYFVDKIDIFLNGEVFEQIIP